MRRGPKVLIVIALALVVFYLLTQLLRQVGDPSDLRARRMVEWAQGDEAQRAALITVQRAPCPGAPFILPSDGFIGLLYGDPRGPYSADAPHQGIDIFSPGEPGVSPVYAAYDGYITREDGWRSALIQRVPDDPLQPGRSLWLYYAHMADGDGNSFIEPAFPPGTRERFVPRGTLLGYTGDYNGDSLRDIWVHLHFSIVLDDGGGRYRNELEFANTVDPSPYLGMPLHYACDATTVQCDSDPACNSG